MITIIIESGLLQNCVNGLQRISDEEANLRLLDKIRTSLSSFAPGTIAPLPRRWVCNHYTTQLPWPAVIVTKMPVGSAEHH